MHTVHVLVILVSAVLHAYWNFLLKRAGGGQLLMGLSKSVEALLLGPVFIGFLPAKSEVGGLALLSAIGAALVLANYIFLARAYRHADLTLAYPISRGGVLLFLPLLGWLVFGERIDATGFSALALIIAGIALLHARRARALVGGGFLPALCAAAAAAAYTIWGKGAVQAFSPVTYFCAYTIVVGLAYDVYLWRKHSRREIGEVWRVHRGAIIKVAIANSVGYVLVLFALRTGTTSYVMALRQLSIAFGVFLGWRFLGERPDAWAWRGVTLLLIGCTLVAVRR